MMGFMAPEILTQRASPSERTDRYSLAVLILHTLLLRNVMAPLIDYDNDADRSELLGWGEYALFSEHPQATAATAHAVPGYPFYQGGALSYRILTPALQRLTERAVVRGCMRQTAPFASREWEEALAGRRRRSLEVLALPAVGFRLPVTGSFPSCVVCVRSAVSASANSLPVVLELHEERQKHNFVSIGRRVVLGHAFKVFTM